MSAAAPKLSVVIPAYNSARFLPETLESLLAQTLRDLEIVVVNDGSADNTGDVIAQYQAKAPCIRRIEQTNQGVSAARNNGLAAATGDYVVFLDADDDYASDALQAFVACAEKTGADIVLGRLFYKTDGVVTGAHKLADALAACKTVDPLDKRLLWNFLVCNKCYRRQFLLDCSAAFPPFGFTEEGAFFMQAVLSGASISGTPDARVFYRRHTDAQGASVSQEVTVKNLQSLDRAMRFIFERAQTAGCDDDYLQEILFKQAHILVSQFYRPLWRGDDATLSLCCEQLQSLKARMQPKRFDALCAQNPDLDLSRLRTSQAKIKTQPVVNICVKTRCTPEAAQALFLQTNPLFALSLSSEAAACLPQATLDRPNVAVTDKAPSGGNVTLRFSALPVLDSAALQTLFRLPVPKTAGMLRLLNRLLKWRRRP